MNEYLDFGIKTVIGVLATGVCSTVVACVAFLFSLKRRLKDITKRLDEAEVKSAVMLYSIGALFDKTFKGIENGRKEKADELLNSILFKFEL